MRQPAICMINEILSLYGSSLLLLVTCRIEVALRLLLLLCLNNITTSTATIIVRSWNRETFLGKRSREFWQCEKKDGKLFGGEVDATLAWQVLAVLFVVFADGDCSVSFVFGDAYAALAG